MQANILPLLPDQAAVAPAALPPATLIITTEPGEFLRLFSERIGVDVFATDSAEEAFELLPNYRWIDIYADFRQLDGLHRGMRWSGQSILREVRTTPAWPHLKFYLMANAWHPHQRSWLLERLGATDLLSRSAADVALRMAGNGSGSPADARRALDAGRRAVVRQRPMSPAAAAVAAEPAQGRAVVTAAGDPWMDRVNANFKVFAGGVGARLILAEALAELERQPSTTRTQYVQRLAGELVNPARRADFIDSLVRDKL